MNYKEQCEPEIDLKNLLFHILYRWRSVIVVAILLCLLASAYKVIRNAALTPEELIPRKLRIYELDLAEYELNKSTYQRQISDDSERLEKQQTYMEKSVLMHIDPYRMPVATADVFVRLNDTEWEGLPNNLGLDPTDSLIKMYTSNYTATLNWEPIEEVAGNEKLYLEEILWVGADYSSNTITVKVVHSDGDTARKILEIILDQILDRQKGLADGVAKHTLMIGNQSLAYTIDQSLAESQKTNLAAITDYESAIVENQRQLEDLKKDKPKKPFIVGFVKYPVAGFVLGILLMATIYGAGYLFDGRLHGERTLQDRYGYRLLGALPRRHKPGLLLCIDRFWDKRSSFLRSYKQEETYERISVCINNLDEKLTKILVTGTADLDDLHMFAEAMSCRLEGTTLIVAPDMNTESETLKKLVECDGVLLVEEEERSLVAGIRQEYENIHALDKPVIGYVLL